MTFAFRGLYHSLAGKYALLVGLLIFATGGALGITSYVALEQSLHDRYRESTEQLAHLLGEFTAKYMYELRIGELRLVFREIQARDDVLYAFAVDGGGTILADGSKDNDRLLGLANDSLIEAVRDSGAEASEFRDDSVHIATPVRLGSEEIGVVRVGLSLATANEQLSATRRTQIGVALSFVVFSLLTTFVLLHRTGRRLNRLRGGAQAAAGGHFDIRVGEDGEMEVRELAQAFNAMLDAIGEKTERINRLAYFDPLTGAANRSRFQEKLDAGLVQCNTDGVQLAAMFFDLDRFKQINDTLGHAVGDEILCGFNRVIESCRPADTGDQWSMVARLGGDEFTLLIVGKNVRAIAANIAGNILQALLQPMQAGDRTLAIGTSIGIACYPEDANSKSGLMQAADLAMYAAKEAGRNTYRMFCDGMRHGLVDRFALENKLRQAVDRASFELHYQPIMSLETNKPVGVEALLRWRDSPGHLIAPDTFLPVAEESGLILPIGHWVMREACRQALRWRETFGRSIAMSINLSARQLEQAEMAQCLLNLLDEYHLDASNWLTLEITETAAMDRPDAITQALAPLRDRGVRIAIDDFGTGYSSLSYLQDFAFDALKIDKSFIVDLVNSGNENLDRRHSSRASRGKIDDIDHRRRTIVAAVVQMAHALDYRVVAEGIETDAQRALLRELGCELGQGYLFSKPLSATEATLWLGDRLPMLSSNSTFTQ